MRILFPYLARWKAVNWTRYHSLLTRLARMGHEIYVLQPPAMRSTETNFQEIDIETEQNFHIEDARLNTTLWNLNIPLNKLVKKGYYALAILPEVKRIVREKSIDVMLLYNIPHYSLMNIDGCKKVFDFADDYIAMLKTELGATSNPLLLTLGSRMLDNMIRKADLTTCVSNVLAEQIRGEAVVLPNGVDLNKVLLGNGAEIRRGIKTPVVGFIGSFEYFIDFELILKAAAKMPDATFLLVGSGRQWKPVKDSVEALGLKNVILTGGVPHERVFSYIDAMDVCLNIFKKIPISHGACPIKLFEYLGMKKPVISTRLKEVELIDKRCIFYADTVDELTSEVKRILDNKTSAMEHAGRGYRMVVDEYNWDSIADKFMFLLENVPVKQAHIA